MKEGSLKKFLIISGIAHLIFFLYSVFAPDFNLFPPKKQTVTWIKLSKGTGDNLSVDSRKNTKQMPEHTLREQKEALKDITKPIEKAKETKTVESPIKKKEPPKKEPVKNNSKKGAINPEKKKPQTKEDKTIEDALSKLQSEQKKKEVRQEAAQVKNEGEGQSRFGTAEKGDQVSLVLLRYSDQIVAKVQKEWIVLPNSGEAGQKLKAIVNVMINDDGTLISSNIETNSGDASFDLSVMRAIERASPFPIPPEELKEQVRDGILIEFSPNS